MPHRRTLSRRAPRHLVRILISGLALVLITPLSASASLPIDPFASYQPQTRCSPKAKPGTLALEHWLLKKYPGSTSLGISRPCSSGGVSEHKEGRAFDWGLSIGSARDRRYAADFLAKAFATDADGNRDALARRLGIMYIIWNDHIYGAYTGFTKRSYVDASCKGKPLRKCSATLRHRNHMHISLSRDGG
ncbi:MAG: hypothetical protein ACXVXE_08810, partial [Nocardioidaceae bacterium]